MPQYTRKQLLDAVREDHPELKDIGDDDLFSAISQDHPDLVKGITPEGPAAPADPTRDLGPGELALYNAKRLGNKILDVPRGIWEQAKQPPPVDRDEKIAMMKRDIKGMAKSLVTSIPQSLYKFSKGIAAGGDAELMSEGTAQFLTEGIPSALALRGVVRSTPKSAALADELQARANVNVTKALAPKTLETKAMAQQVAPELSQRGMKGLRGTSIDRDIIANLDDASGRLEAAETRLLEEARPEYHIHMEPLVGELDAAIGKLNKYPSVNANAIKALKDIRSEFAALGKYASFEDAIGLRRALDKAIDDSGGFRKAANAADRTTMLAQRGGANLIRKSLNELDQEFAAANKDFSLYRNAADIVERRELADVGSTSSGLPGRGSLLDDILAGWAGQAIGGGTGFAIVEGANLIRQSRGYSRLKGTMQQSLADALRPPLPAPRALIGPGPMRFGSGADASAVTGTPAAYAKPQRLLAERAGGPYAGKQGFPFQDEYVRSLDADKVNVTSTPRTRIEVDPATGERFLITEGRRLKLSKPKKK